MSEPTPSPRPNIILILADDMGFSDLGCYGSEIQTPHLNALARQGAQFTQMYNCARCCPTRASLLTGLYPHQAGVGHMVNDKGYPGYRGFLRQDCHTIAESLKTAGYRTYLSGKWHVGGSYHAGRPESWRPGEPGFPTPNQRGFDTFWGILSGAASYFNPHTLMDNDRPITADPGSYFTDSITDHACEAIAESAKAGSPFFLYAAYTAPHWPLHALPEDIARYEGRYACGWDAIRTARHEELKGRRLLDARWDITPRDEKAPDWKSLDPGRRDWEALRMACYAAMVDRMDQGVGRILAQLEKQGIAENTMVMFLSDNGGCAEFLAEDGHVQQYGLPTLDGRKVKVGNLPGRQPGPATTFMSYDLPWANASNAPFRLYKHWVHEGGISTPFLVRWPGRVRAGGVRHEPCHVVDVAATCLEAAEISPLREKNGVPVPAPDGESLLPALSGGAWQRQAPIFFEHENNRAVRAGELKLVARHPGPWELYDMNVDRTELHDLSGVRLDKVRELDDLYRGWAESHQVLEWSKVSGKS